MKTTLRRVKPRAYGVEPPPLQIHLLQVASGASDVLSVDTYEIDGSLAASGEETLDLTASAVFAGGIGCADGYWAFFERFGADFNSLRLVLWRPGEARRVHTLPTLSRTINGGGPYTVAGGHPTVLWDATTGELLWVEFTGGDSLSYTWALKSSTLETFPTASTVSSVSVPRPEWYPEAAEETSVAAWPRENSSVPHWLSAEYFSMQAILCVDHDFASGDSYRFRHVRLARGAGVSADTDLGGAVFLGGGGTPGTPILTSAQWFRGTVGGDGQALGARSGFESSDSALRPLGDDLVWGDPLWPTDVAGTEAVHSLHRGPAAWAALSYDGAEYYARVGPPSGHEGVIQIQRPDSRFYTAIAAS